MEEATDERHSADLLGELLAGALAGFVATAPMTVAMQKMHQGLPWWERYPLPPSQIVSRVAGQLGLREEKEQVGHTPVTLLAHFGYGATMGAIYAPLARSLPLPALLKGVLFGMIVWSSSYLGLLPALGILRPATHHPPRRTMLMIAAHLVWGAVLGVVTARMRR